MRTVPRPHRTLALALLAILMTAVDAAAQPTRDGDFLPGGLIVGARVGYDFDNAGGALTAGAGVRVGVPGLRRIDLQGVADFTFLDGLTERQYGADLLVRFGTFAVGGGPVWRNTIWRGELLGERETRSGWSGVVVLGGEARRDARFVTQLELRHSIVSDFSPTVATLQIGIPLRRW